MDGEYNDLEKRVSELEEYRRTHDKEHETIDEKVESAIRDIGNIWYVVKLYLKKEVQGIGKYPVPKKTIAGVFISLSFGLVNFILQFFDVY